MKKLNKKTANKKTIEAKVNFEIGQKLDALKVELSDTEKDDKGNIKRDKNGKAIIKKNGKATWGDVMEVLFKNSNGSKLDKTGKQKVEDEIVKILYTKNTTQTITQNQLYKKLNCNKNSVKEVMFLYLDEINEHHKKLGWKMDKIEESNKVIIAHHQKNKK